MTKTKILLSSALACGAILATQSTAQAAAGVNIGTLSCHEAHGWGYIVGSSRRVNCTYSGGGKTARFDGHISKFGADIGYQNSGVLVWSVIAPTSSTDPESIAGHYGGVTAGASVGVGVGANALLGGFHRSIALQPISVEGTTGLDVAAGIGSLTLQPAEG